MTYISSYLIDEVICVKYGQTFSTSTTYSNARAYRYCLFFVLRPSLILSRTTRVSQHQKGKTSLDLLEQEVVIGNGISWAICKSAPWHITMPASHHSVFYRLESLPATQPTASNHWRHTVLKWYNHVWIGESIKLRGRPKMTWKEVFDEIWEVCIKNNEYTVVHNK